MAAAPKHEVRRRAFALCFASFGSASHARVVQREPSVFISGVALDQCWVPERYHPSL